MIGIPGSGKTEFAKHLNGTRVSFDDIREDLYGDANEKGVGEEIQREFRKRIYRLIRKGKNVIIDFNGYELELGEPLVGSAGTVTQNFQLLKNSTIVLKNGTLKGASAAKRLIQNYANLFFARHFRQVPKNIS